MLEGFPNCWTKKINKEPSPLPFFTALDPSEGDANLNNVSVFLVFKCGLYLFHSNLGPGSSLEEKRKKDAGAKQAER